MSAINRRPGIVQTLDVSDARHVGDMILCGDCGSEDWTLMECADHGELLIGCGDCGNIVTFDTLEISNEKKPDGETYRVGPRGLYGGGD
jgi:hypothetical protein